MRIVAMVSFTAVGRYKSQIALLLRQRGKTDVNKLTKESQLALVMCCGYEIVKVIYRHLWFLPSNSVNFHATCKQIL